MPSTAANKRATDQSQGDPWGAALRILTRRDYSESELRKRLTDKGFEKEQVDKTIVRCLELGYLDDVRFARNRATGLMRQGKAVGKRILLDLRQRGVCEKVAENALAEACEEYDETRLLQELLEKRFPDFNYNSAAAKEKRRVVHFLQRRGFQINRIMDQLTRKGLEASDEDR